MAAATPICNFGEAATPFSLQGTDGRTYTLEDVRGERGTLIVFICNHCPYVRSIVGRFAETAATLQSEGIGVAAICANDASRYPEDSFEKMQAFASANSFGFPYLHDETQAAARAFDAVCTPDFFGYSKDLGLQYRGRLDASKTTLIAGAENELLAAMRLIAETGEGPKEQIPSVGCSIKWKVD